MHWVDVWLAPLLMAQALLGAGVVARLLSTAGGGRNETADWTPPAGGVSVIVPVLDERNRLAACLDGLLEQGPEVAEILVVDGGSRDGTPELVESYRARDRRLRLLDASPVPADWNGKPWGLQVGLEQAGAD